MRPCEANDNDRFLISAKGTVQDLVDPNTVVIGSEVVAPVPEARVPVDGVQERKVGRV